MSANIGPNMTPMVDVVMCILIFFMLGSSFLAPELFLQSNMPAIDKAGTVDAQTSAKLPAVRLFIQMHRQSDTTWVVAFGGKPMAMDVASGSSNLALADFFDQKKKSLSDDVQIIIVPDKAVPYQDVITVYDLCTKSRFKQVAFAPAK
jgi:biopolymer transport protein ExbD